ncbi:MAG: hypothetical protein Q9184_007923 [Pyrenodesmia sp. 2 TL-2023]
MSNKPEAQDWSLASREKRSSPLGSTLFVGLRAADAVLQYNLLRQGWAHEAVTALGGTAISTVGAGQLGLTPYGTILTSLAIGSSLKHIIWKIVIGEQEMKPAAAVAIAIFNTLLNSANTLLSAWAWCSAAPTNLPSAVSVTDVLLSSPWLLTGCALFGAGIATELGAEVDRMRFKAKPENKGKPYGGGLWSLATNINYGGYTLWRAGYAIAAAGPAWGLAVGAFFFYDFTSRAIPELDRYCSDKVSTTKKMTRVSPKNAHADPPCSMGMIGLR